MRRRGIGIKVCLIHVLGLISIVIVTTMSLTCILFFVSAVTVINYLFIISSSTEFCDENDTLDLSA